jgi:ACS family tartrate transporter-like MFS transporter
LSLPVFQEHDVSQAFETALIKKIAWRILPLILVAYCIAYLDRANIAVAALTMNKDLGFSAFTYGLGAGIFFLGYFIFEVPSNLILERVGARRWIARIMFTWGILSAACAFVTGPTSFIVVRFLLGVAEAGFFPGVMLYFTYWFPARFRGRITAILFLAGPTANALSNVAGGALLDMNGVLGLRGWQWVFISEAAPAVILSFVVFRKLIDRSSDANWLKPDERQWLEKELDGERAEVEAQGRLTLGKALMDSRVVALSTIYFLSVTAGYGTTFFLPQIVKGLGMSNFMTGLASAIPYLIGMIALLLWGWSSDRRGERRWHLIAASVTAAVGFSLAGVAGNSFWSLPAICLAVIGIYGTRPTFWPLPSIFLSGTAAAGGIALINSIGNLGGYVGPFIVGWIEDSTNSFEMALYFLAACSLALGIVVFVARRASDACAGRSTSGVRGNTLGSLIGAHANI